MSPTPTFTQPRGVFPNILRGHPTQQALWVSWSWKALVIFCKKKRQIGHDAWSELSLRSNLNSEPVSLSLGVLRPNFTGGRGVPIPSTILWTLNGSAYSSLNSDTCLLGDSLRFHRLRLPSHKTFPLPTSDVSGKPRLLHVFLTNWL